MINQVYTHQPQTDGRKMDQGTQLLAAWETPLPQTHSRQVCSSMNCKSAKVYTSTWGPCMDPPAAQPAPEARVYWHRLSNSEYGGRWQMIVNEPPVAVEAQ